VIVVVAALTARPEAVAEVEAIALAHVRRARAEPGCIRHEVSRDVENPYRFVFTERWVDLERLATHSMSDTTRATVESLHDLILENTTFDVFEAKQVTDL
jgi:quinol monooxygenase YgiN